MRRALPTAALMLLALACRADEKAEPKPALAVEAEVTTAERGFG